MPEDTKKQQKGKNDPKEQRKRRGRQQQPLASSDKKPERETEPPKNTISKVPDKPDKPVYEPPPPEFYKNLKRETDEILKITEEANSKYKKKEILSNWSKYEMPIESYEEIDEQENLGADFETLAKAPLSIGGHFQFKHEKSWDVNTGPSMYDKYFDIHMENLNIALSTIPFFERNGIDQSIFNEMDLQTMNHRATKFKQKYYKDKKYMTPELEAQERILSSLTKSDDSKEKESVSSEKEIDFNINKCSMDVTEPEQPKITIDRSPSPDQISLNTCSINDDKSETIPQLITSKESVKIFPNTDSNLTDNRNISVKIDKPVDDKGVTEIVTKLEVKGEVQDNDDDILFSTCDKSVKKTPSGEPKVDKIDLVPKSVNVKVLAEPARNPVIESPEDLEKWLDDFLDG